MIYDCSFFNTISFEFNLAELGGVLGIRTLAVL